MQTSQLQRCSGGLEIRGPVLPGGDRLRSAALLGIVPWQTALKLRKPTQGT